ALPIVRVSGSAADGEVPHDGRTQSRRGEFRQRLIDQAAADIEVSLSVRIDRLDLLERKNDRRGGGEWCGNDNAERNQISNGPFHMSHESDPSSHLPGSPFYIVATRRGVYEQQRQSYRAQRQNDDEAIGLD